MAMKADQERGSIQRAIFMLLLREGGWWTQRELSDELSIPPMEIHARLKNMTDTGCIVSRKQDGVRLQYAVTLACSVPTGLPISQLQEAGLRVAVRAAA